MPAINNRYERTHHWSKHAGEKRHTRWAPPGGERASNARAFVWAIQTMSDIGVLNMMNCGSILTLELTRPWAQATVRRASDELKWTSTQRGKPP